MGTSNKTGLRGCGVEWRAPTRACAHTYPSRDLVKTLQADTYLVGSERAWGRTPRTVISLSAAAFHRFDVQVHTPPNV
jgi:hypothetical protein